MKESLEKKIKKILPKIEEILKEVINVKTINNDDINFKKLSRKIKSPHPYIFFMLFKVMDYTIHGHNIFHKSLWHVIVKYKDHFLLINEHYFTIELYSDELSQETENLFEELIEKLIQSCDILNEILKNHFKEEIKSKKCYVNNIYWNVKRIYEFFRETFKKEEKYDSITEIFKGMKSNESFSFGLILSFFSTCEFILDVFFILDNPKQDFFKFQRKNWYDKFEVVFNIKNNSEIGNIYEDLKEIRGIYRNAYAHGMTYQDKKPDNLLVNFNGKSIPVSYRYVSDTIYYGRKHLFDKEKAESLIMTFENFFQYIKNTSPYNTYFKWIETGWEIPLYEDWIMELKLMLKDEDRFIEYAEERSYREDRIDNRDFF